MVHGVEVPERKWTSKRARDKRNVEERSRKPIRKTAKRKEKEHKERRSDVTNTRQWSGLTAKKRVTRKKGRKKGKKKHIIGAQTGSKRIVKEGTTLGVMDEKGKG